MGGGGEEAVSVVRAESQVSVGYNGLGGMGVGWAWDRRIPLGD